MPFFHNQWRISLWQGLKTSAANTVQHLSSSLTQTMLECAQLPPKWIEYRYDLQLFCMLSDILYRAMLRVFWIPCPDLTFLSSLPTSVYLCCKQLTNKPVVYMNFMEENKSCWQRAKVKKDKCQIKWKSTTYNAGMLIASLCMSSINWDTKQPHDWNKISVQILQQSAQRSALMIFNIILADKSTFFTYLSNLWKIDYTRSSKPSISLEQCVKSRPLLDLLKCNLKKHTAPWLSVER